MLACDFRLCDVCECKVFYDAELGYELNSQANSKKRVPYRIAGRDQCRTKELTEKYGKTLWYLGDWAVICNKCSKEYKTQIVKIEKAE
jgi:hypothetical protein